MCEKYEDTMEIQSGITIPHWSLTKNCIAHRKSNQACPKTNYRRPTFLNTWHHFCTILNEKIGQNFFRYC